MEPLSNSDLDRRRMEAAMASGGTSSDAILRTVVDLLERLGAKGDLLEYGAGKGDLAGMLLRGGRFSRVVCADLLPRPESLDGAAEWIQADLNNPLQLSGEMFDVIVSTEVIEHLENPRAVFREFFRLLRPSGTLLLTTPNQESIRSLFGLMFGGHFTAFLGKSYPAHITALVRLDICRIASETGFNMPTFHYTNSGGIPKMPQVRWQKISHGLLRGRLFSDNLACVLQKPNRRIVV